MSLAITSVIMIEFDIDLVLIKNISTNTLKPPNKIPNSILFLHYDYKCFLCWLKKEEGDSFFIILNCLLKLEIFPKPHA